MKIQCDVCEKAEAAVLCCADEAVLCWRCDGQIHAANKVAGKHQRVPLLPTNSSPSQIPTCDICQEKAGYFFCLEDRALLCRHCDMAIHTASPHVSSHQRFLITGVRLAPQHHLANTAISISNTNSNDKSNSISSTGNNSSPLSSLASTTASIANKKMQGGPTSVVDVEEAEGFKSQWLWNDMFDATEFDRCYGLSKAGSSS